MQNRLDYLRQRITRDQLTRFGFSFLLAVMLWGWVTQLQDPVSTRRYAELAIEPPELAGGTQIVTALPRATVSLRDVESQLDDIERSDISISLDVSEIDGPGTYRVPVVIETTEDIREVEASPDSISIQVEEEISRNFPLTVENQLLAGDARRISDITAEVSQVTVNGTQSLVERIERVVLPVSLDRQTTDFTALIEPYAVDEDNQRVQEISIMPDQVRTHVEVETRGKTVSVVPQIVGTPAEGLVVQQQVAMPSTVIIDGPDDVLESILFVNTEPVDISGATQSLSQTVQLEELPDDVSLVEPRVDQVEVRVSIGSSAGTPTQIQGLQVEIENLGEGSTASVDPETVALSVTARTEALTDLNADDIEVSVDLGGLGPGVYSITPDVTLPEDVSLSSLEPQTVTVLISAEATPSALGGFGSVLALSPE